MEAVLERRAVHVASAQPGTAAAEELSRITDEAVSALAQAASARITGRWALVALGGYGSGRLLPASDIDLLVLSDVPAARLKPFVEGVLYPLWDAGLKVGHQVRSRREHLAAVRDDVRILTASLTARPLAGDAAWATAVLGEAAAGARKRSRKLLAEFARRERPGSPYLLEPQLKEGAGGQRDLDELVWSAAVVAGRTLPGLHPLVEAGALAPRERDRVRATQEKITAARWDLHLSRPRDGGLLALDAVDDVRINAELVQSALADAHHVLLRVRSRLAGHTSPSGPSLSAHRLLELAECGQEALPGLEEAAWSGRLDKLVPGMRALMTARRPGLSHLYTVGDHCLRALVLLSSLGTDDPGLARSLADVRDRRVLVAATLAHDLGKAEGGAGHAERGAPQAAALARRLGVPGDAAEQAGTLVREHLLLAEAAATENVDDEDAVLAVAARVGERDLLPALHVLTAADSLATGPPAWTPWHAALVGTLVARLDAALSDSVEGAGIAVRGEKARSEALARIEAPGARSFLEAAPLRYLAARSPEEMAAHATLVAALDRHPGAADVAIDVTPGPMAGMFDVAVAAADRPELFARIAGALSLASLDILGAEAYSAHDGAALDIFTVRSATRAEPDHTSWTAFEGYLRAALADRLQLEKRLAKRKRHYAASRGPARPSLELDISHGYAAVVRVRTADRVGLLHDLAKAIAAEGLDLRWAKAMTRDGVASDVFHVTDAAGEAPTDPGILGHLSMRLREVL
ncbi:MAG: hypothetical protein C0418_02285 [Coriobacteriaceae bacterium]|nr:hypothetical protein [Coriobacteriaceae bacterium]